MAVADGIGLFDRYAEPIYHSCFVPHAGLLIGRQS